MIEESPVKRGSWEFNKIKRVPPSTMVFKRYPMLDSSGYFCPGILVRSLLGLEDKRRYVEVEGGVICNDAWMINIKTKEKENYMMDSFLRGFGEDLKKKWEGDKPMVNVDVDDEMKDLFKIYTDAENHLKEKKEAALRSLTYTMKNFIDIQDEHRKIEEKLHILKNKLKQAVEEKKPEDKGDDE